MSYFARHAMDLLDGERTLFETLEGHSRTPARDGCARWRGRSGSRVMRSRNAARAVGWREGSAGDDADAV
jgi:hypothetical protein